MLRIRFTLRTLLIAVCAVAAIIGGVSYHLKTVGRLGSQLNAVAQQEVEAREDVKVWRERAEYAEEYQRIKGMLELVRYHGHKGTANKAPANFPSIPKGPGALPALLEALDDPVFNVKAEALTALMNLGDRAAPAYPRMIELLMDDDEKVRVFAAYALSVLPSGAREAQDILILLLDDGSAEVRKWARIALEHILPSLTEEERNETQKALDEGKSRTAETPLSCHNVDARRNRV